MYVSEFYAQAKQMFSGCDEAAILSRLSDAVRLISNKGINDPLLGEIELCVCSGCVTLPRDVGTVLGVDVCGQPTLLQDQWFKYHINGPGTRPSNCVITEMGRVCTFRDPSSAAYLTAEVTSAADNNKKLRVYATDTNGKKIYTAGPDGQLYEGFLVPLIFGYSQRNPNAPAIGQIYRISKEDTKDFVRLYAVNAGDGASQTLIGEYEPTENNPNYRRIKVPNESSVLVKYKKASFDLRSQRDWINIENREVLRLACRAVKFRLEDKINEARPFEDEASRILSEETEAQRPSGPRVPQIVNGIFRDDDESLLTGYGGEGGGGW